MYALMKTMKRIFLFTIIFFFSIFRLSYACSCIEIPSISTEYDENTIIFIGKPIYAKLVTEKNEDGKNSIHTKWTLEVNQLFKGKLVGNIAEIITGIGGGDCAIEFKLGWFFLVYAKYHKNAYHSYRCGRTTFIGYSIDKVNENISNEIIELNSLKNHQ